jgi:hypothetical protein
LRLELAFPEQRRPAGLHAVTLPDSQLQHFPRDPCGAITHSQSRAKAPALRYKLARPFV